MTADEKRAALDANRRRVDPVAMDWRQGDVFRSDDLSPHVVADLDLPLTEASLVAAQDYEADHVVRVVSIWHDDDELALISQDCDIVEASVRSPYLSVAPVVAINPDVASQARSGYMPGLAPIPALGSDRFADLARVATVEKSLLLRVTRVARLRDEDEARMFRGVVHRHFSRTAFPDELSTALARLRVTLRRKTGKDSAEGRAIDAVAEIRVKGFPAWDSDEIDVTVFMLCWGKDYSAVLDDDDHEAGKTADAVWLELREKWQRQCEEGRMEGCGNIKSIDVSIEFFEQMTAADYVDSDPLDLGGMSPQPA